MLGWGGSGCNSEALPEGRLARNSGVPRSCGTSDRVGEAEPARWASANRGRACHLRPPRKQVRRPRGVGRGGAGRFWSLGSVLGTDSCLHGACPCVATSSWTITTAIALRASWLLWKQLPPRRDSTAAPCSPLGTQVLRTQHGPHCISALPTVPRPLPAPGCTGQPRVKGSRAVSLRTPCRGSPSSRPVSSCSGSTGPAPPGSRGDG